MKESVTELIEKVVSIISYNGNNFSFELSNIINNKKVTDHHAIIPTMENAGELSKDEKRYL